jgi:protein-S-isoprenylcysteine O-methyltransferase Ste14
MWVPVPAPVMRLLRVVPTVPTSGYHSGRDRKVTLIDKSTKERLLPPRYLNWILVLQIGLHFIVPMKTNLRAPYSYLGLVLVLAGVGLNIYSTRFIHENGATLDFAKVSSRLLVTGPFRFSRNPVYLSGVIVSLGIAISLGSLIAFLFPPIVFLALNKLYIPAEEMRLENRFGRDYLDYKHSVSRWI